jgi:hypothetical protein
VDGTPNGVMEGLVIGRIVAIVGGLAQRIDDGSADGQHDYEIVLNDGQILAVEVTGGVDGAMLNTVSAAHTYPLDPAGLRLRWDVNLAKKNPKYRKLSKKLPAILIEYEGKGQHWCCAEEDVRLGSLGIASVQAEDDGSGICLSYTGTGYWLNSTDVVDIVADHGTRTDNVHKLSCADVDERHLAMWIHVSASEAYTAINGFLPDQDPAVNDVIDTIWTMRVNEAGSGPYIDIVWQWTRGAGWKCHGGGSTDLPG